MNVFEARLQSFKSRRVPRNPSNKSTSSVGTILVKWPHPPSFKATPATLADAGFVFAPSASFKDNVVCFFCDKELNDWNHDDDPSEVHFDKCADTCSWASLKCGLIRDLNEHREFIAVDPSRLPSSKALEKCRLDTFVDWPHDTSRGHGASSKKMAKAGFVYTPQVQNDDSASCLYCGIVLNGWEYDDDPMEEHHKRDRKLNHICAFFSAKPPSVRRATSIKPSSRSSAKPKPRPRSTRGKQTTPEIEPSSDDDADTLRMSTRTTRSTKSRPEISKPSALMTSRRAAGASKGKAATADSEVERQSGSEIGKAPKNRARQTKSKAKIAAISEEEEHAPAKEEQLEERTLRKSKRGKEKVKEVPEDIEVEVAPEEQRQHLPQTRRQTQSKSRAKFESDSEAESSGTSIRPTVVKSRSSRSRVKRTPSRTTTKKENFAASALYLESSDAFDIPKVSKPRSKAKHPVVESEPEDTWESALEAGPENFNKTSKKPGGRQETSTEAFGKTPKPSREEATPLSGLELLKPSSLIREEEKSTPQSSKPGKKPALKIAPFHDKSSNQRLCAESDIRIGAHSAPRTSVGSKENANAPSEERESELQPNPIIDISDDAEDLMTRKPVSSRPAPAIVVSATSTADGTKTSRRVKKKLEIVIERRTPKRTSRTKEVVHDSDIAMEIDVDTEGRPLASDRSKNGNHNIGLGGEKPRSKHTVAARMPLQERPVLEQGGMDSDSAMDVDGQVLPSTPPRVASTEELNPFSLPVRDNNNPLLAFQPPYGKLPVETVFTLTKEEKDMTIEEWTKRELEIQLENFKRDGYRRIQEFKVRAAEVRRQIEAL